MDYGLTVSKKCSEDPYEMTTPPSKVYKWKYYYQLVLGTYVPTRHWHLIFKSVYNNNNIHSYIYIYKYILNVKAVGAVYK